MPVVKASDIESTLASIQAICNRCILRFKGCRDPIELTASPVLPELSCPACLNLLNTNHEALSAKIHEQLASKGYTGLSSFLTSIQLPFAPLAIRNRAIRLYLEDALVPFIEAASTEVKKDTSCVESKATEPIVESTEPIVEEGLPETITVREALKHIFSVALTTPTLLPARKSPLHIQIEFNHATLSDAWVWLTTIPSAEFEVRMKRKRGGDMVPEGLSINRVDKALAKLRVGDFKFPLNPVVGECVVESIKFLHEPMWIAGRYNKLARHISNSPWVIDGKRMTVDSVQELIDVVLIPAFGCKGVKFSSAGREDADVKMLGTGRPFYFEILDPKKVDMSAEDVMGLEKMINEGAKERLFVRDLQITTREDVNILKDSASTKCKTYTLLIHLASRVDADKLTALSAGIDLELKQRNPTRVPRRADLVRDKVIHTLSIHEATSSELDEVVEMKEDGMYCVVEMKTSAGTYVKEFVHGDGGRTVPCLASLLEVESASVVTLDVLGVDLLWPPALAYEE